MHFRPSLSKQGWKKIPKKCQKLAGNSLLITALWCLSLLTAKQQNMQTHDRADGMGEDTEDGSTEALL